MATYLGILAGVIVAFAALAAQAQSFSATPSGAPRALILDAVIAPATQDVGRTINIYVAAELAGQLYARRSDGSWAPLSSPLSIYRTAVAGQSHTVSVTDGSIDLSAAVLDGLNIYVGYGQSEQDMLANSKFARVYTHVVPRCAPSGALPAALLSCRNWIAFAPPRPFNPNASVYPSEAELRIALSRLASEGWRGLVTYSLDGTLQHVPRIAKEVGFTSVVAGLFWFDAAQLARERTAALAERASIDAYVLGNEGLLNRRYTREQLSTEIQRLRADTGKPVATSETLAQYQGDATLVTLGDWVFPNLQFWFDPAIRTPAQGVASVQSQYQTLQSLAGARTIVIKEAWYPTAGDAAATQGNQSEFFRLLAATPIRFVWGEAFNQFWKSEPLGQGPNWGLHTDTGSPMQVITTLRETYTGPY